MTTTTATYRAEHIIGGARLADEWDTVSEARQGIDEANARAVSRGYSEYQYQIVKHTYSTEFDEDRLLRKRITVDEFVEFYPATDPAVK